jgi:hypothetical protein
MPLKKEINADDLLPYEEYAATRRERKRALTIIKKNRRIEVGPHATFFFENYDTMWHQIQEMLHIERGGDDQVPDELAAYNPLVPQGRELVATVMFEIGDPVRRANVLSGLGGIEEEIFVRVGDHRIAGVAETDVDRTTADGKASSVQFVHFPFTDSQIAAFRNENVLVEVGFTHENYAHSAGVSSAMRTALNEDFD